MPNLTYPGPQNIHRTVLDNGIVVLAYENFAAQSIVVEGVIRAGAMLEERATAGLADFVAATLMRGTENHSFDDIYERLEGVNARLGFSGDVHFTSFNAGGLAEDLDLMLDLLADTLRHPTFPAEQIERVRGEILTGLQMRANDTRAMASLAFDELLYGEDHPYGRSPDGYPETILSLGRDDLAAFHATTYGPEGMIIAVVGAVEAGEAVAKVRAALGDWRNPNQPATPDAPAAARPLSLIRTHVPMPDKTQSDIVLGLPAPPRSAPDYLDLSLMNTVLGVFGMMGRLGKSVREEQGLAYYVHSRLDGDFGPTPWYVSTGVAPEKVEQAIESIRREIGRIQDEPVPDDELADSKAYRTGSLPVRLETNRALAGNLVNMELYELGLDYLQQFPNLVEAITPERIQAAAQKYLSADQLAVAVAGPNREITMLASGVDLIEVARIERAIARHGRRFFDRFFTAQEQAACNGRPARLAGRFAVKEAVAKALGTGVGDVNWTDIEVVCDGRGKPELVLHNRAKRVAEAQGLHHWSISLSHTDSHAIGFAIAAQSARGQSQS